VQSAAVPFTSHGNVRNYAEPKQFSWARSACVGFSSSNFTVQDHIPSTGGDALRTWEFDTCSSSQHPGTSTCSYGDQSKPTATSTSSIGSLLWLSCGWTPTEWTLHCISPWELILWRRGPVGWYLVQYLENRWILRKYIYMCRWLGSRWGLVVCWPCLPRQGYCIYNHSRV